VNNFDSLDGWGKIRDKARKPFRKVLGKSVFNAASKGINEYGGIAVATVATIATGGAAAPTLALAAADIAAKQIAKRKAEKVSDAVAAGDAAAYAAALDAESARLGVPVTRTLGMPVIVGFVAIAIVAVVWVATRRR